MEYITKNELYEEIRIRDGLVLKIQKYKLLSYTDFKSNELKGNITKVGEKLHKLKKEIIRNEWSKGEITYPIGTYIINKMPVEKCSMEEYCYEVTSSGGSIMGSKDKVINDLNKIIKQIENTR